MKTVKPFSNGTEFDMWDDKNCSQCSISNQNDINAERFNCHIDEALTVALFGYGDVKESIIELIGFDDRHFLKNCPFRNFELKPVKINLSVFKQLRLEL